MEGCEFPICAADTDFVDSKEDLVVASEARWRHIALDNPAFPIVQPHRPHRLPHFSNRERFFPHQAHTIVVGSHFRQEAPFGQVCQSRFRQRGALRTSVSVLREPA